MNNNIDLIHEKFYNSIDKEMFYKIISLDPTTIVKNYIPETLGSYSKWLLNAFRSHKIQEEDFYKITPVIQTFEKNKQLKLISKDKRDINRYSSSGEIVEINNKVVGSGKATCSGSNLITDRYHIINGNARIYYEDENWLIVIPLKDSAAYFYSHNTSWCTKNSATFYQYNASGSLYIIINKNNISERFQMHRASNSFMDKNDKPVIKTTFLKKYESTLPSFLFTKPTKEEIEISEIRGAYYTHRHNSLPEGRFLKGIELGIFRKNDPSYQKWTQWLFLQLKERRLAYKAMGEVNYCNSCETVLAREQVKEGKCDRCNSKVELKQLEQWYFKITDYKDRLIKDSDGLDYPESTINSQRAWLENLHDRCVSRQRKWGCPIPIEGETDTLDTFVDSSFYFIRYCDPNNENELCSKEKYKQVDLYVGGSEHACMHLIYARFIQMFLFDIGVVSEERPFKRVIHQGMILNEGKKMSKSLGNVVNPDDYDYDELRFYLMFIGHYFDGGSWSDKNLVGIKRFISRMKEWMNREGAEQIDLTAFKKQIFDYTEAFKFNKVVSSFMTFFNQNKSKNLTKECKEELISLLEIYMPGIRAKLKNDN